MPKKKQSSSVEDFVLGTKIKDSFNIKPIQNIFQTKPKRDTRKSFTTTQKKQILAQQDFKCAKCHNKLGVAYHFHHAKSWSSGGKTIVKNGRALCANCHETERHKERLKKVDKKRQAKDPFLI